MQTHAIPSLTVDAIIELLGFCKERLIDTRRGTLRFRSAPIMELQGQIFWKSWQRQKVEWLSRGFSVSGAGSAWNVVQWLELDGSLTTTTQDMLAQARRAGPGGKPVPMDWIPNDVALRAPASTLLRDYQKPSCLRLIRALLGKGNPFGDGGVYGSLTGNALDASDTGSGKTYVALAAAQELGLRPCIVAPLAVLPTWRRASQALGVPLGWLINYDKIRGGKSGLGRWHNATNERTGKPEKQFRFDYLPPSPLLIFDECQACKNEDTLQGKLMRDADRAKVKILGVSATAAEKTAHLRILGGVLGLHEGTLESFKDWEANLAGRAGGSRFDPKKPRHLQKLHEQVFPLRGTRIRTSEIPDFPEVSIVAESLDTGHTADIAKAYADMETTLRQLQADTTKTASQKRGQGLAAMMAARIEAEKGKIDLFVDLAREGMEEGRAPILFLNFKAHMAKAAAALGVPIIWGSSLEGRPQKPEERQRIIDDFQHDRIPAVVVSLGAGGAGISLHDVFNGKRPRYALISPSYSAVHLKQAFGRAHRDGGKTKTYERVIFAEGTIEDDICDAMRDKLRNIDTINDGALAPKSVLEFVRSLGSFSFENESD